MHTSTAIKEQKQYSHLADDRVRNFHSGAIT